MMPANEASGIGGRSYGRIALYLQEVSNARSVLHYNNSRSLETLRFFLVEIENFAVSREVKNSLRPFLRSMISSKTKHEKMKRRHKSNKREPAETGDLKCVPAGNADKGPVVEDTAGVPSKHTQQDSRIIPEIKFVTFWRQAGLLPSIQGSLKAHAIPSIPQPTITQLWYVSLRCIRLLTKLTQALQICIQEYPRSFD